MKPTCGVDGCTSMATIVVAYGPQPLVPMCSFHEYEFMCEVGQHVSETERDEGWRKFCKERGYDPDASTFGDAYADRPEVGK